MCRFTFSNLGQAQARPPKHIAPREGFSRSAMRASGSMYENEISRALALALVLALAQYPVLALAQVLAQVLELVG